MAVSAVEAAAQASRINQAAMLGLTNVIESNFQKVSQAQQLEADVYRNIAESAINFRQREIDNFFKQEGLKLREKELNISAQQSAIGLDLRGRELGIREQALMFDMQKSQQADRNKPLLSSLTTQLKATEDEFQQLERQAKFKLESLKNLSPSDIIKNREEDIKREIADLESSMFNVSKRRNDISYEMTNIANGGEYTGQFYKIPGYDPTKKNIILEESEPLAGPNPLLPSASGGFPAPSVEAIREAEEFRSGLGINEEEGQIPNIDFQAPIPEPERYTKDQLLRLVMDERFKPEQVAPFIQAGDEEAKQFFQQARDIELREYLGFYASGKGYDPSGKLDDPNEFQKFTITQFQRYGGDLGALRSLTVEARVALSNARMEAYKELSASGDVSSDSIETLTSIKYNNWIDTRLTPAKQPQAEGVRGINPDGTVPSGARPDIADQIIAPKRMNVDDISDSFWSESPSIRAKRSETNKKFSSIVGIVRDKFSIRDGVNPSSLNNKFLDFVRDNSDFRNIILPESSFTPLSMDPYGVHAPDFDVKSYRKELKNKLSSMEFKDAVLAFEKYFEKYPEKLNKLLEE